MPLVRFEIRNEYRLGAQELYREADKDDPKSILDGLAVAGLVGILRQLGDLAQFAAEVFHDLQEQVIATAGRSKTLMIRVQQIEVALPPLEMAVLSQTSHMHFAYTAGSDWQADIRTDQNHLAHSDLPRFIMDSYEECRDPPCLHFLDKFDTGGPGACLIRYSDPSFFKRALASSDSDNTEKFLQEKHAYKTKKRRERQKNIQFPVVRITSEHNGRLQFYSPSICLQNSNAETISTTNMRSRSELGKTSFDSTKSDYIDCIFYTTPMPHNEHKHNGLPTSRLERQIYGNLSPIPPCEQNGGADGILPQRSLSEKSMVDSSYVTWDEKTQLVKPSSIKSNNIVEDQGDISELMPADYDQNEMNSEVTSLIDGDPNDIIHDDENLTESLSYGGLFDEIGSETDHYLDALTEVETDVERQPKQEQEPPSANLEIKGTECNICTVSNMCSQSSASSDFEPCVTSYSSSDKLTPQNPANSVSSEDLVPAHPPEVISMSPNPNLSTGTDFSRRDDVVDASNVNGCGTAMVDPQSFGCNIPNSQPPLTEKMISSLCGYKEFPKQISGKPSIKIWTNGSLLGLAPSKPPDSSSLNATRKDSIPGTRPDEHGLSRDIVIPNSHSNEPERKLDVPIEMSESTENNHSLNGDARLPDTVRPNGLPGDQLVRSMGNFVRRIDHYECSTSSSDKQNTCLSENNSSVFSSNVSNTKFENSKDSCYNNNFNSQGCGLTDTDFMVPGAELPNISGVEGLSSKPNQETRETSSDVFLPSHILPLTGLGEKVSLAQGNTSEPSGLVETDFIRPQKGHDIERKDQNSTLPLEPNPKEHLDYRSLMDSLTSSPPLEHMKISFHPTDKFDPSKLKLMFRDGHHFNVSIKDVPFPSFQLLPEPTNPLNGINSESDDDTFSGSSRYMSDELLSQQSESNSEDWTSSRTPGSEDNEIYDALRRVSSDESISSSFEVEEISHQNIYPGSDFKIPNTKNGTKTFPSGSPINILKEKYSDCMLQCADEPPPPPPPPLPPMQWCVTKPQVKLLEDNKGALSFVLDHQNDLQVASSDTSQASEPPPPYQQQIMDTPCSPKRKEQQNLNGRREAEHALNAKDMDENEDLLVEIRTKSMSLRRIMPSKPILKAGPATDFKVTAILEKANAIRQAFVGSDEDEDNENWSDG